MSVCVSVFVYTHINTSFLSSNVVALASWLPVETTGVFFVSFQLKVSSIYTKPRQEVLLFFFFNKNTCLINQEITYSEA